MNRLRQIAFVSVARTVGLCGLGIFAIMWGLSPDPVLALRSGGILLMILLAALLLQAEGTPLLRQRQPSMLLGRDERPGGDAAAQATVSAFRDASLHFAWWIAGAAVLIWGLAVIAAWMGLGLDA